MAGIDFSRRRFFTLRRPRHAPAAGGHWLHLYRAAMACRFQITLPSELAAHLSAAREALEQVVRLEARLTVFRDDSEVAHLNRAAAVQPVAVEPGLFELLALCRTLGIETAGAFDITATPLSRCWGFLRRQGRVPTDEELSAARACVGQEAVRLDAELRTVRFAKPGVEINFGSIGKGYALDRVAARLRARGAGNALLTAGASSVVALGRGTGDGWPVGIRHPQAKLRRAGVVRLRGGALATSGSGEQFFEVDGRRYGHVIDPRTGRPVEGCGSATVVAPTGALSDGLATAFHVGGPELAEAWCAAHPGVMAILVPAAAPDSPLVFGDSPHAEWRPEG